MQTMGTRVAGAPGVGAEDSALFSSTVTALAACRMASSAGPWTSGIELSTSEGAPSGPFDNTTLRLKAMVVIMRCGRRSSMESLNRSRGTPTAPQVMAAMGSTSFCASTALAMASAVMPVIARDPDPDMSVATSCSVSPSAGKAMDLASNSLWSSAGTPEPLHIPTSSAPCSSPPETERLRRTFWFSSAAMNSITPRRRPLRPRIAWMTRATSMARCRVWSSPPL
mmetsp:Transcript_29471/g.85927  ORF Transcript_29471/g.85927 Transcript_29471/m.85927 type:complete len:225 (-) Transcript_29471:41-715(-)